MYGLIFLFQGRTEQPRGRIHYGDDPLIGHAGRSDDAEYTHDPPVDLVGGGYHTAFVQRVVAGFLADEDLDTLAMNALVEQMEDFPLLVEGFEQVAQFVDIAQFVELHKIGLARHDVTFVAILFQYLVRHLHRRRHHPVHGGARFLHIAQQGVAYRRQVLAGEMLVQEVGRLLSYNFV